VSRQGLFKIFFWLLFLLILEESIRYAFREGDFVGYAIAGDYALHGKNLYSHWLNTWPPLFSIFCIPIYLVDMLSPLFARVIWQLSSLAAFMLVFKRCIWLFQGKRLAWFNAKNLESLRPYDPLVLLPFALSFKYLLDNASNIQINVIMLALCVEAVYQWKEKDRSVWAAFLIALTLSLKVYTLFFFVWFILIKQFRFVGITLLFVGLLNLLCFLFYGPDLAWSYYTYWWTEIAQGFPMIHFKNQSFFGAIWRLTVPEDVGLGVQTNLISLSMDEAKKLIYFLVMLAGAWPAWHLLKTSDAAVKRLQGMVLFIALIPLLSPLAWKAYFIFLLPALIVLSSDLLKGKLNGWKKVLFWLSMVLWIGSAELFIGRTLAEWAQVFSFITLGTIGVVWLLILRLSANKKEAKNLVK